MDGLSLLAASLHHWLSHGPQCPSVLVSTHFHSVIQQKLLPNSQLIEYLVYHNTRQMIMSMWGLPRQAAHILSITTFAVATRTWPQQVHEVRQFIMKCASGYNIQETSNGPAWKHFPCTQATLVSIVPMCS